MGRWRNLFKEDLRRSFGVWERHQAGSVILWLVISAILAFFSMQGIKVASYLDTDWLIAIGFVLWLLILVFIITPIKMLKEKDDRIYKLETKVLKITGFDEPITPKPDNIKWLRLRVENPSAVPITNCYGKLIDRRLLFEDSRVRESGQDQQFNDQFPPIGHYLIWYDTNQPLETIPPNRSPMFLGVVAIKNQMLFTSSPTGLVYPQHSLGRYEFTIEFGSTSEALRQTIVSFKFKADLNNNIHGESLEDITQSTPDKEGSQN